MKATGNAGPGVTRPRRLLLCLDGVPHQLILAAKNRGLFERFATPARLLSPFPTMTNVALAAMFKASPPPGYESFYFDRNSQTLQGGIRKYIGRRSVDKIPSSYMDQLDYQEPLAFEFLIYVAPEKIWRADMRRFHEHFRTAPQTRDYFAFLKGTDGLLHAQGPARLAVALESLDQILVDIQQFCGEETEIVLFSDHGMNLEENRRVSLVTHLRRCNFVIRSQLGVGGRRDVSVPTFGLCSYAAIYCADSSLVPEVAAAVTELAGVDFAVYRENTEVIVEGAGGLARIEQRRQGGQIFYRYHVLREDPLALSGILGDLHQDGLVDEDGFAEDSVWLKRTQTHSYPDVLANLYNSLARGRVKNTADILVSLRDGFYYGWSAFSRVVRLLATHGNALKSSSYAFMMSSHRDLPASIRADEASQLLRE